MVHLIGCLLVWSYGSRSAIRGSFSKETLRLRSRMVCVTFACVVCGHMAAGYKHHIPWCEPCEPLLGFNALSLICCITHLVFCESTITFLSCCCCVAAMSCVASVRVLMSTAVVVAGLDRLYFRCVSSCSQRVSRGTRSACSDAGRFGLYNHSWLSLGLKSADGAAECRLQ